MSARVNHMVRSAPPNGAGWVIAGGYKHATPGGVKTNLHISLTVVVLFGCGRVAAVVEQSHFTPEARHVYSHVASPTDPHCALMTSRMQ